MNVLVTGANGFVGYKLVTLLSNNAKYIVRACTRSRDVQLPSSGHITIPDLDGQTDWSMALASIDVVVHTAARVHVMHEAAIDPLAEFRRTNMDGTINLATQAAAAGVRRFIFISSIKVNGEETSPGKAFYADDIPAPQDPYAISKYEAEQALLALARRSSMEVVIIRPVLVYGPGVKANFLSMMQWIHKGIPLPLGSLTRNRRSMVALENLLDLISVCLHHPAAANQIFLVSDGEDLSTTELLTRTAQAIGVKTRLLPMPVALLMLITRLLGKSNVAQRLCGSLQVDISKTRDLLDWQPPLAVDAALQETAAMFLDTKVKH